MANDEAMATKIDEINRSIRERRAAENEKTETILRERGNAEYEKRQAYEQLRRCAIALDHPELREALAAIEAAEARIKALAAPK